MRYIKTYFYQIVFMLLAIVLLVYGLIINCGVMMAISSGLAIMVWFIDSFKNIRNTNKIEKEIKATINKVEEVEDNQKWHEL